MKFHNTYLNDQYYFQNYYEQDLYRKSIKEGRFPIYRGLKMKPDDVIRREVIRHIRTFFNVEFDFFDKKYPYKFKEYFEKELKIRNEDGIARFLKQTLEQHYKKIKNIDLKFNVPKLKQDMESKTSALMLKTFRK